MCNLSDALMKVLESYFYAEPSQFAIRSEIIFQIKNRYEHLREQSLDVRVERRIKTLVECGILSEEGSILGPGSRWESVPVDQLEE
ncbi:hypothetical protein LCGC14_1226430 [marine sediment metagenome]|uniref:Uncharacterized protein n=1 Tax=marine sediment metagenome TaxID=412755 RepID=A0A0F9L9U0_9ZZZZ